MHPRAFMESAPLAKKIVVVTGFLYIILGLVLLVGGAWLIIDRGPVFYALDGLGVVVAGTLLIKRRRVALWVFAAVLLSTFAWAVADIGFDWWPLAARVDVIFLMALWLLTPWITRNLVVGQPHSERGMTMPLWLSLCASGVVLLIGLASEYHDVSGSLDMGAVAPRSDGGEGQPKDDWRDYGRTQYGQRYSPLDQITPANVTKLRVAWVFRTGDLIGKNDPQESTFEVTPIKVRDTLFLCSQHQRLFALEASTGKLRWSYDPEIRDNPTFQHLTCRGVSYHETAVDAVHTDGTPARNDCPRTIFLPVNDGRMVAINADTGQPCESFGDHGTLNLEAGMGDKTFGFYEPTSPPVVSDKILVVAGAVVDNYSTHEPSGVIRGFDIHTGKLVWAWDPGAVTAAGGHGSFGTKLGDYVIAYALAD